VIASIVSAIFGELLNEFMQYFGSPSVLSVDDVEVEIESLRDLIDLDIILSSADGLLSSENTRSIR